MSEFTIRSESVDVEQIMKQIRQRILEKRGADYTEEQIRELASVRLEKFLEPKNLRSDLLEQFRRSRPAVAPPPLDAPPKIEAPYAFDDQTLFASHRGLMRFARKLLRPLLKLLFNPNTLNQILHTQAQFNVDLLKREARRRIEFGQKTHQFDQSRAEWNMLYYEVLHNIVLETTRMGIEAQNLRMRVESLSSRLDFSERRVRALEGVVQYRPEVIQAPDRRDQDDDEPAVISQGRDSGEGFVPGSQPGPAGGQSQGPGQGQGDGSSRRKRRRRRGRRGGAQGMPGAPGQPGMPPQPGGPQGIEAGEAGDNDGPDDADGPDDVDEFDGGDDMPGADEGGAADLGGTEMVPNASDKPDVPESDDDGEQ